MTEDQRPLIISNPILNLTLEVLDPLIRMQKAEQAMIRELEAKNAIWGTNEDGEHQQVTWLGNHFSLDGVPQDEENKKQIRKILNDCLRRMTE